ncbi:cytochrome c [Aequorivita todarodis]|uniref:c-type cytochrome n=1 Tax=Aequorivita todarodis TaxID=2036821 RepID=UPI00234FEF66|nr:cytochrome c [Aequorivita todarodis]MDC7999539.1 cytochrome c [Aequorivita todarodis]
MKQYLLLFSALIVSCTTSTYDDIVEIQDEDPTALVTFQDVAFVFENNCTACHSNPPQNGAPMSLTNYSEVKNAVETRALLDRISRNEGEQGLMPLGGPRLPQQQIDLIIQWNRDGLLEN